MYSLGRTLEKHQELEKQLASMMDDSDDDPPVIGKSSSSFKPAGICIPCPARLMMFMAMRYRPTVCMCRQLLVLWRCAEAQQKDPRTHTQGLEDEDVDRATAALFCGGGGGADGAQESIWWNHQKSCSFVRF